MKRMREKVKEEVKEKALESDKDEKKKWRIYITKSDKDPTQSGN